VKRSGACFTALVLLSAHLAAQRAVGIPAPEQAALAAAIAPAQAAPGTAAQDEAAVQFAPEESEDPPEPAIISAADLRKAAATMAAIFVRSVPGLAAREVLHQRGRRAQIDLSAEAVPTHSDNPFVKLPQQFRTHDVVSDYALTQMGPAQAIHEIRSVISIDGRTISKEDEARHSLTLGVQSADDELKRRLLENFERNRLEGAVTDFGPLLLLFAENTQNNYVFTPGNDRLLNKEPMVVLSYQQIAGTAGLSVFRDQTPDRAKARDVERTPDMRQTRGEIWFRKSDLLPLRITVFTDAPLPGGLTVRDQAIVDYTPTPYGLAPVHIRHLQYLGSDLVMENDLQYSGYQRLTPGLLP
jgi:hypothetical protein